MSSATIGEVADLLHAAEQQNRAIPPVVEQLGAGNIEAAYAVQEHNTQRALDAGRRLVGRKAGLTSKAVQAQLGVDQPDYGALFADMAVVNGDVCGLSQLIQPKVEAEIAFVLGRDLDDPALGVADMLRAVAFAVPALEIVDSRVADWKISIVDTIADNGSSARFVLGNDPRLLSGLSLETVGMVMSRNGEIASVGSGSACLGHPLTAAIWLARTMASSGAPLREGDVLLTGALGPMAVAGSGERFEARISGFEPVSVTFE